MDVSLIKVPDLMGDERQGASKGPDRLVEAGADRVVSARGLDVSVESIIRGRPFRDSGSSSMVVCKELAAAIAGTMLAGRFPLVLGGGCDISKGVLAGFDHSHCGVIWFDAHGDFNTPDSTITGYLPGMALAVRAGHCYRNYWGRQQRTGPGNVDLVCGISTRQSKPA